MEQQNQPIQNHTAALEALLFVYAEPLSISSIEKALQLTTEQVTAAIADLEKELVGEHRGMYLLSDGKKLQLVTKPEFSHSLESFAKGQLTEELTPAALEVLAIISYCAPVGKAEIEHMRGVNSSITLRNLLLRGLIEKSADTHDPQLVSYVPSFELLRHLGVTNPQDLPEYDKYKSLYSEALSGQMHDTVEAATTLQAEQLS